MVKIDVTTLMALASLTSALMTLAVMQVVTTESGFRNGYSRTQLCQRASLATLALALAYDAYSMINVGVGASFSGLLTRLSLLGVLFCWAYRKSGNVTEARSVTIFNNAEHARKPAKVDNMVVN